MNGDTGSDGSPNGYQVFEGNKNKISWYYKATGQKRTGNLKHTQKEVLWNDLMLWSLKSGTGIKTGE